MSKWVNITVLSILFVIIVLSVSIFQINDFEEENNLNDYDYHIVLISKENYLWNGIKEGVKEEAKKENVAVEILNSHSLSSDDEIKYFDMAVNSRVDGIIINGYKNEEFEIIANRADDFNIPVVFVNDEGVNRLSYVGVNNYLAGKLAINKIKSYLDEEEYNIAIVLDNDKMVQNGIRLEGILSEINNNKNMNNIVNIFPKSSKVEIYSEVKKMIRNNPEINLIVATTGMSSEVVAQVVVDLNMVGKIKIVAFDDYPKTIRYINKGVILFTIDVDANKIGLKAVEAIIKSINGEFVEDAYYMKLKVIDSEGKISEEK